MLSILWVTSSGSYKRERMNFLIGEPSFSGSESKFLVFMKANLNCSDLAVISLFSAAFFSISYGKFSAQ